MGTLTSHEPLSVSCEVSGPIFLPDRMLSLDGILAFAVVMSTGQPSALTPNECVPVEIPVRREPDGRFHLASFANISIAKRAHGWTNRRFPIAEAQAMGDPKTVRRILTTGGTTKSFRLPREELHLEGPLVWYCEGIADEIRHLLTFITYLGKRRGVGLGRVVPGSWSVATCAPWDGFPVMRAGRPLRTLPLDWPGLIEYDGRHAALTYPYRKSAERPCAAPLVDI